METNIEPVYHLLPLGSCNGQRHTGCGEHVLGPRSSAEDWPKTCWYKTKYYKQDTALHCAMCSAICFAGVLVSNKRQHQTNKQQTNKVAEPKTLTKLPPFSKVTFLATSKYSVKEITAFLEINPLSSLKLFRWFSTVTALN